MTDAPAPDPGLRVAGRNGPGADVRPGLLLLGVGAAGVALLLGLVALPGGAPLAVGVLLVQLLLALGLLALAEVPAPVGAFTVAAAAAVAADAAVVLDDGGVGPLAGVVGLALVGTLLQQLSRRQRQRVTEALADTMLVVVLVAAAACLPAVRQLDGGREVVLAALAAAGAALLAGRLLDLAVARPPLVAAARRGWPGLLLGLLAGAGAALVVAAGPGTLSGAGAAALGLAVALAVASGDLAVDLVAVGLPDGPEAGRRASALRPVGLLLPFAVLGPVALVAGRILLAT